MCNAKLSVGQKYIYIRDSTFFNVLAFTGDRAGDLGSLLTNQIYWLPDKKGIIFSLTKGKTVDIRDPRVVIIYERSLEEFCPVKEIKKYIEFCELNKFTLKDGFFFDC